jgi:BlaI family transcriptional regulator, penicillinase repressor
LGEANVKDVRRVLTGNRKLAYTTVMTVLDRLERRGGVCRRKVGRSFVYTPTLSRESLRRLALKEFVDSFFDGSTDSLKSYLVDAAPAEADFADTMVEAQLDPALL